MILVTQVLSLSQGQNIHSLFQGRGCLRSAPLVTTFLAKKASFSLRLARRYLRKILYSAGLLLCRSFFEGHYRSEINTEFALVYFKMKQKLPLGGGGGEGRSFATFWLFLKTIMKLHFGFAIAGSCYLMIPWQPHFQRLACRILILLVKSYGRLLV